MKTIDQDALRNVVENVLQRLNGNEVTSTPSPSPSPSARPTPAPAPAHITDKTSCDCPKAPGIGGKHGVFTHVCQASEAAHNAFLQLKELGVAGRSRVIELVKEICVANAEPWGKFELDETKIGRLDHKIEKLQIARSHKTFKKNKK